jgi:hypothetical protein
MTDTFTDQTNGHHPKPRKLEPVDTQAALDQATAEVRRLEKLAAKALDEETAAHAVYLAAKRHTASIDAQLETAEAAKATARTAHKTALRKAVQ